MKESELISIWKREESVAHIHGWDFSHIEGRYTVETDLPWNYHRIILDYLRPEMKLLDIDTGSGEFLNFHFQNNILRRLANNFVMQALTFWMHRNALDQSNFLM